MKYYFFVTVLLIGSFFVGQNSLASDSDIMINEIGAYPTSTHEWVEIWNRGADTIDIKDWKFWENNTNHGLKANNTSNTNILPGKFAVICQDADVFLLDYPGFVGSVFDSSWTSLSLSGEEIGLKNGAGNFVEQFSYISSSQFSLERKNPYIDNYDFKNWSENTTGNTVGLQNSNYLVVLNSTTTSLNTSTDESSSILDSPTSSTYAVDWLNIKLNEIISDPTSGNELVELYNVGSSTYNLSGGLICDSSDTGCKMVSGTIFANDWLIVDLFTDRYLNNSGDSVIFKNGDGNIVDRVDYGTNNLFAPEKGQSLIRVKDGLDNNLDNDWAITNKITLGSANELTEPEVAEKVNSVATGGGVVHLNTNSIIATSTKVVKISTSSTSNVAPKDTVNISWKLDWPYGLDVGEIGLFSAKGSADPRGGNVNYFWNFGDSNTSTESIANHSYVSSGIYIVSVIASSTAGTNSKKDFKVYVGPTYSVQNSEVKIVDYQTTSTEELEYIKLINNSYKPQNISGWKIKNKSGKEYELPENTIINASNTLKFYKSIHHLSFDKNGDEIRLLTPNDKEVDKIILNTTKKNNDIKIATSKPISNWLSIHGIVTVEPKIFGQQFFYISDGQNGYQVYQYKKDFPNLKIGDEVLVGGEISKIGGVTRVKIKNKYSVKILSTNKIVEPIDLVLEDTGENLVGSLVKISGDITEIKSNLMYVDDGSTEISVYFKKGAKINKQDLKEGDKIDVVGVLAQGKDGWQVLPRSLIDITVIGHTDEVLANQAVTDRNRQDANRKKYLTTTAGGLSALLLGFVTRSRGVVIISGVKKIVSLGNKLIKRG